MNRLRLVIRAMAILCTLASALWVNGQTPNSSADPRIGTWKLNLEKSQFAPGSAPGAQVRKIEAGPDGFTVFTQTGIDSEGNPNFTQAAYKFDGKEYPEYTRTTLASFATAGAKPNTNKYRLVDAYTVEISRLDATGKVTAINRQTMSKDGKSHSVTSTGRPGIQVWERQ
jgi:hypothetical protein